MTPPHTSTLQPCGIVCTIQVLVEPIMRYLHPRAIVVASLFFLFFSFGIRAALAAPTGFQLDETEAYSRLYYQSTFTNINHAQLGTLQARVPYGSKAETVHSGSVGCTESTVCAGVLVLLRVAPTTPWYRCIVENRTDLVNVAKCVSTGLIDIASAPLAVLKKSNYAVSLVVDASPSSSGTTSLEGEDEGVDYGLLVEAFGAHNTIFAKGYSGVPIVSLLTSNRGDWTHRDTGALVPLTNISLAFFDTRDAGPAAKEWTDIVGRAAFNTQRWQLGYTFPMCVSEIRDNRLSLAWETTTSDVCAVVGSDAAFSASPCTPLGGWTTWAALGVNTNWAWDASQKQFVRTTPNSTTALFVPTTVPGLTRSGYAVDPLGPATAIVTAVAALELLQRVAATTLTTPPPLYVFFVPDEWAFNVGSARVLYDAYSPPRCRETGPEACAALAYGKHLNFTTIRMDRIDRVVTVDHLHASAQSDNDSNSLCYHVDERVEESMTNGRVSQDCRVLDELHVTRSPRTVMALSPTHVFTQLCDPDHLARLSALTLSSHCGAGKAGRSGGEATKVEAAHSRIHASVVAITRLVLSSGENATATDHDTLTVPNMTLIRTLLDCFTTNWRCEFLSPELPVPLTVLPHYSSGVFDSSTDDGLASALGAALRAIGLSPLKALALPPRVAVPRLNESSPRWTWESDWTLTPGVMDTVVVESVVSDTRGVRTTIVTSSTSGVVALFVSLTSAAIVTLLLWCHLTH